MPVFVVDERNKAENEINLDEPDARIEKDEDMKLNQLWQLFNKKEAMNKKGENEIGLLLYAGGSRVRAVITAP